MRRICLGILSACLLGISACGEDLGDKFDSFLEIDAALEGRICQCEGDTSCGHTETRTLKAARTCIVEALETDPAASEAFLDCAHAAVKAAIKCLQPANVCSSEALRGECEDQFEDRVDACSLPDALEETLEECDL